MARYDIILGLPWMKKHRISLDWDKRVLTKKHGNCAITIYLIHRQRAVVDKKENRRPVEIIRILPSIKDNLRQEVGSTHISTG